MKTHLIRILAVASLAVAGAGCVSRVPAPVADRSPTRPAAKPAAPAIAPAAQADSYVVKRGDTLYSIALDQGVDWRELASWNQLADPTKLQVGQILRVRPPQPAGAAPTESVVVSPVGAAQPIVTRPLDADLPSGAAAGPPVTTPTPPAPSVATPTPPVPSAGLKTEPKGLRLPYSDENLALLQRGDAPREAVAPKPEPVPAAPAKPEPPPVAKVEPLPVPKPEPDSTEDRVEWTWPTAGKVVGTFNGATSKGVDIAGRVGDPVYASASGKVVYSGEGIPAYGKLVIIRHNSTYLSAYAHNSQILVKEGQNVAKGQKIAEVGSMGAEGPRLHFEIRRLGKPVDPLAYLPNRPN
ncbi:MAG TPA: peptidoglycan DD-metalloendopeptidase family protein [Burkholderiales bacterium]|nr:peptidoglycan DD-metalloendopeptidase family protein [Burkholderiales bacterium]